jgi:probable HAF family extracellular repeat protein
MLSFGFILPAWGLTYTYSNIEVPGAIYTAPTGINDKGEVVGNYETSGKVYGFLLSNGSFTTISCPNQQTGTFAVGINDNGVVVGYYGRDYKNFGFVYVNGVCQNLDEFNGSTAYASGINNAGHIVGYYYVGTDVTHGFLLQNGAYTDISVPNSTSTNAFGINATGDISGTYTDSSGGQHGFLLRNGAYQTIDYPAAVGKTSAAGLNSKDYVVGSYLNPTTQVYNGFVTESGNYIQMMAPGSVTTFPTAINDGNVIVGDYFNGTANSVGFIAKPSPK